MSNAQEIKLELIGRRAYIVRWAQRFIHQLDDFEMSNEKITEANRMLEKMAHGFVLMSQRFSDMQTQEEIESKK